MAHKIAPSILSADFSRLKDEIAEVEKGGADWIHVDVMDGHFVPNITIGPLIVEAIRPHTKLPLDVHLMIDEPDRYVETFAKAGADVITIHQEATRHLHRSIYRIKELGVKAGVALNPATPLNMIEMVLADVDLILFMTVNPGFGGQQFIPQVAGKIEEMKQSLHVQGLHHIEIEVDGGINAETIRTAADAGASVFVAGSSIFGEKDREMAIRKLRSALTS